LGKRASEDRESTFGGSEERLRSSFSRGNAIEMESPTRGSIVLPDEPRDGDIEMKSEEPSTREGSDLSPADAGMSGLGLTSPNDSMAGPATPKMGTTALLTPEATPPRQIGPQLPDQDMTMADALRSGPPPLPPRRRSLALVAAEKFGLQQDAAEILVNVLSQLEYAFDNGEGGNLIKRLFSAKFRQQMLLKTEDGLTESHPPVENQFSHPIIGVEEDDKDLYDGLGELYLGGDEVDYAGKKGYKMDLLDELPPVLYILMRRSQYDFARNRQIKTNTHIKFGETLAMDRFMVGADSARREASIAITREMMRMRARRHALRHHKPLSIPDTFRMVRDALGGEKLGSLLGDDAPSPPLLEWLGLQASRTEEEITKLGRELAECKEQLEATWADAHDFEYELVSVFVHGGTGTGGHYWTYQAALPENGNKFYYYSDDTVKDVASTEVFEDKSAQGVSPALLVYVRKGQGLVDTLHRRVAEEAAAEALAGETGESAPGRSGDEGKAGEQGKAEDKFREEAAASTASEPRTSPTSTSPRVKFAVPAGGAPLWGAGPWLH
jgi:ubiquitin carboxyl-terminal hydrolase 25/28